MRPAYCDVTYDMFLSSLDGEQGAAVRFGQWLQEVEADDAFIFEAPRQGRQGPRVSLRRRTTGTPIEAVNLSSYNYLGFSHHPEVIQAAKDALDTHGLGASSSPVHGGTFAVHEALQRELEAMVALPDRGVSLFSSGYGVNTGTLSALARRRHHVVMDRSVHMSILEGAQLSRAQLHYFEHNDADDLARVLAEEASDGRPTWVCTEGVFSADGDFGDLERIVPVARAHGARVLVDEAHSFGVAGPTGRGVCEAAGVLEEVDLLVITFSKAFGGVGGALIAPRHVARYVDWYARCRMFSCALDPAVAGGVARSVALARGEEGAARRARVVDNARTLRERLAGHVDLGLCESWIVTVMYWEEEDTIPLTDFMQRHGLDASVLQFPATPMGEPRIRLFATSEHTRDQLDHAADVVIAAAREFGFAKDSP